MIELEGIEAKQGDFRLAVEKLKLKQGDFVAVLGNNGSGKSTFFCTALGDSKIKR